MGKKPKFLYRPHEIGSWFASLGRKLKASKGAEADDRGLQERYHQVGQMQRDVNTRTRHFKWYKEYKKSFESEYENELAKNKTEEQSRKAARKKAEYDVILAFPAEVKTPRAVRDAIRALGYETLRP